MSTSTPASPTASSCRLLPNQAATPRRRSCRRGLFTQAGLAALTERVRRRVIRWFRMQRLLDGAAAADMLAWENSGFSVDASVRITLIDRDVPSYFRSLEHLLRYCARPPFALERLSVSRGADGQIARIRYVLPRHKAANWVGPGRSRKSTRPGANGVVELSPFEFLDRLTDLVPPPRKHRHRYHGVFAPNHKLRPAVTSLAIGNVGKRQEAATGGHGGDGHATEGCCDANPSHKPRSHDTSRKSLGQAHDAGGGGVSFCVPELWRRHPAHCLHHGARADPEDSHTPRRTTRAASRLSRSWPAQQKNQPATSNRRTRGLCRAPP